MGSLEGPGEIPRGRDRGRLHAPPDRARGPRQATRALMAAALQFALVGCGFIGRKRSASIPSGQLRYACDLDATRAAELAKAHPGCTAATDYQAALADPAVTA